MLSDSPLVEAGRQGQLREGRWLIRVVILVSAGLQTTDGGADGAGQGGAAIPGLFGTGDGGVNGSGSGPGQWRYCWPDHLCLQRMTVQLSPDPVFKAFDNNGEPLSGGLLYTYVAGTSTPQVTYTDSTQTTPNTNPIVLNARGEAPLWLNVSLLYKFLLTDSLGNTIPGWPVDNIYPIQPGFPPNANGQYTIPAAIVQPTLTIGGDILARGVALCRYKTTTTSRTSSALFIDPDLQCVVTPGTYSIELTLGINNAGASGVTARVCLWNNFQWGLECLCHQCNQLFRGSQYSHSIWKFRH